MDTLRLRDVAPLVGIPKNLFMALNSVQIQTMSMKSILTLFASGLFLGSLQAQVPSLSSVTEAVTPQQEVDTKSVDALAGILGAIDQGAKAYPEQTSAIAEQLKAMTGGMIPSQDSLMGLASAVQSVWSSGQFTATDAENMASTLGSVLSSANVPLPAWAGNLKSIQDLLVKNGVTTEQAFEFGSKLKDYVTALSS